MSSSNAKNFAVLFSVLLTGAAVSAGYVAVQGFNDANLITMLRLTARTSLLIFLLIFVARPLRQLLPSPKTTWLLKQRRSFGITFAAMHTVHLGLIVLRYSAFPELEYETSSGIFGATTYLLIYLMLVTSFDAPARMLGPVAWRRLHRVGLYAIGIVFLVTTLPEPGQSAMAADRIVFLSLIAIAAVIRLTAWLVRRKTASV